MLPVLWIQASCPMRSHTRRLSTLVWPSQNFGSYEQAQCAVSMQVYNFISNFWTPALFGYLLYTLSLWVLTISGVWCPRANNRSPKPCKIFIIPAIPAYFPKATTLWPEESINFSQSISRMFFFTQKTTKMKRPLIFNIWYCIENCLNNTLCWNYGNVYFF